MRRVRTSLKGNGFHIVVIALLNLFVLLCICVLLHHHRLPRYGANVRSAATHFVMGSYDRSNSHIITVTPGDVPRFFIEEKEVKEGLAGVEKILKSWDCAAPNRVTVVLVCDEAVAVGTMQRLADMVLMHGFTCTYAGRPALD